MLVLSRKTNQDVIIRFGGKEVVLRVCSLDTRHNSVRLGFEAPDDVEIDRREIREKKDAQLGL